MPRPKRTKVQGASTVTKAAVQKNPHRDAPTGVNKRAHREDTTSGDSEGLITKSTRGARPGTTTDPTASLMSGGLGDGDMAQARRSPRSKRRAVELSRLAREADHAAALEGLKRRRNEAARKENFTEVEDAEVLVPATAEADGKNPKEGAEHEDEAEPFNPDDESTPLHLSKSISKVQPVDVLSLSSPSNPRKRKLTSPAFDIQVPVSSPPSVATPVDDGEVVEQSQDFLVLPPAAQRAKIRAQKFNQQPAPQIWSDTMAPPASSSSSSTSRRSPDATKSLTQLTTAKTRRKANPPRKQATRHPSTTTGEPKTTKLKVALSTATLQELLPRRRRRGPLPSDFDILSSDDTSEINDDLDRPSRIQPRKARAGSRTPGAKPSKAAAAMTKTYATPRHNYAQRRRRASDKENASTGDDYDVDTASSSAPPVENARGPAQAKGKNKGKGGGDLAALAQKFREVDGWALAFEDVTASSSSPWDAR
ncbi:MAG: hypothetical protein M1832_000253 [Thelocarpon impressellum]|nr:MAG: hypothetical protein M1832_000253 [Thelocarpon impressellum]